MVYRMLLERGAEFEPCGASSVAVRYPGNIAELDSARTMAIADLSPLPRVGFKGRDTPEWLRTQGVELPDAPNLARIQPDRGLVLRLSDDEHVILSDLAVASNRPADLAGAWRLEPGRLCYPMPRDETHCWFALTGGRAPEMLAKVCAVDLRAHKFDNGRIAQTSVARTNGVVVRSDLGETLCFYVLADSASAEFLWTGLLDAMDEFKGAPAGLAALQALSG